MNIDPNQLEALEEYFAQRQQPAWEKFFRELVGKNHSCSAYYSKEFGVLILLKAFCEFKGLDVPKDKVVLREARFVDTRIEALKQAIAWLDSQQTKLETPTTDNLPQRLEDLAQNCQALLNQINELPSSVIKGALIETEDALVRIKEFYKDRATRSPQQ